ncbi:MAG TPA: tetratricopeptide repeat protein [Methanoregulaceae archaeon]|nr:tetratricopeptide repeat protein [Methanoregulaceae archaeon]
MENAFWQHYKEGQGHYYNSQFADAATLYEQAMNTSNISPEKRLMAKYSLASSLFVAGFYKEAITLFGEIYSGYPDDHQNLYYAFNAYERAIHVFVYLYTIDPDACDLDRMLVSVEDGLRWSSDCGNKRWRHVLLLDKSDILAFQGRCSDALDVAEEAYAMKKGAGGGYYAASYIENISRFARKLGYFDRAQQVIDELDPSRNDNYAMVLGLTEQLRLFMDISPFQEARALETAKWIMRHAGEVQAPKRMFDAFGMCVLTFIRCMAYDDALISFGAQSRLSQAGHKELDTYFAWKIGRYTDRARNMLATQRAGKTNRRAKELSELLSG